MKSTPRLTIRYTVTQARQVASGITQDKDKRYPSPKQSLLPLTTALVALAFAPFAHADTAICSSSSCILQSIGDRNSSPSQDHLATAATDNETNSAAGNTVTMTGVPSGLTIYDIFGGYRNGSNEAVDNNTVIISGGEISRDVYGGESNYRLGAQDGSASNNKIRMSGGQVRGIYGGYTQSGAATGNKIVISGGNVLGSIYGGYNNNSGGTAINNHIDIEKGNGVNPAFGSGTILYGNNGNGSAAGNTLNLSTKNISVNNIQNFEKINFYVQDDTAKNNTLLTLTHTGATDIGASKIGICIPTTVNSTLAVGDKLTLIAKSSGNLDTPTPLDNITTGMTDCDSRYTFSLKKVGQSVVATVTAQPSFSVGGTVAGLPSGATLTLRKDVGSNNVSELLTLSTNSPFVFNEQVAHQTTYQVSVDQAPAGLTCQVANGSGTATANVNNIVVQCYDLGAVFSDSFETP